jgi:hypothetical protein
MIPDRERRPSLVMQAAVPALAFLIVSLIGLALLIAR